MGAMQVTQGWLLSCDRFRDVNLWRWPYIRTGQLCRGSRDSSLPESSGTQVFLRGYCLFFQTPRASAAEASMPAAHQPVQTAGKGLECLCRADWHQESGLDAPAEYELRLYELAVYANAGREENFEQLQNNASFELLQCGYGYWCGRTLPLGLWAEGKRDARAQPPPTTGHTRTSHTRTTVLMYSLKARATRYAEDPRPK